MITREQASRRTPHAHARVQAIPQPPWLAALQTRAFLPCRIPADTPATVCRPASPALAGPGPPRLHRGRPHRGVGWCGAQFWARVVSVTDVHTRRSEMGGYSGERKADRPGPGGGRRGVPAADRPVPARAAGALLPDPRLAAGRRGRAPGHAAGRLAGPRRFRGAFLDTDLVVPGSDQPLPQRPPISEPPAPHWLECARRRAAGADAAGGGGVARALP